MEQTAVEPMAAVQPAAESKLQQEFEFHFEDGQAVEQDEEDEEDDENVEDEEQQDDGQDEHKVSNAAEEAEPEAPSNARPPSTPHEENHAAIMSNSLIPTGDDEMVSLERVASSHPRTPSPVSPISVDDARLSMASIALSDTSLDYDSLTPEQVNDMLATPRVSSARHRRKPSSLDILQNNWAPPDGQSLFFDTSKDDPLGKQRTMSAIEVDRDVWSRDSIDLGAPRPLLGVRSETMDSVSIMQAGLERTESMSSSGTPRRTPGRSSSDYGDGLVDWQKLDETEEQEKEDKDIPEGEEDESTAFLLARLEQENAKFTPEPTTPVSKTVQRARAASRPPSIAHLKKLVSRQDPPTIRYSLAPEIEAEEAPPMTELEFWAALVQDYLSTAVRLPTLTTTKIRSGIPPPLRGVVWTSMAGARDRYLEDAFEKLVHEKSPYEGIINKDVGRSFPGVELFRDADGEGQRMLGRVLKCFSLQDKDIGYCQGLGFLVGPLLMNMGEREAFCVLVRLMDHYSLRPSFLPSLSGLHMRIYQFSSLLKQHNTKLHEHLALLGVEPAYLSQWFLSCFAVTCPLAMLFRIYDVIFAEGANETVMRIALALMRRHEERILNTSEFEDVMQLLLGREIWDTYGGDADELVDDFTSLGDLVTHGRLSELERDFETRSSESVAQSAGFLPDVQAAASRFLGRLWTPGHNSTPSKPMAHTPKPSVSTLSPPSAEKEAGSSAMSLFNRPGSFLRKSPSKMSLSLNDSNGSEDSTSSGSGSASLASTAPTEHESSGTVRESVADSVSTKSAVAQTPGFHTREQQELHGQIEDLLTALSEMQREHAQLAAMLQREREERGEDHRAMRQVVGKMRKGDSQDRRRSMPPQQPIKRLQHLNAETKARPLSVGNRRDLEPEPEKFKDEIEELMDKMHERLTTNPRFSSSLETRAQLRSNLARTREQLTIAETHSRELTFRLEAAESSVNTFQAESDEMRAEVNELRSRVADEFKAKQKLEHQLSELRAQARSVERKGHLTRAGSLGEVPTLRRREASPEPRARHGSVSSMPTGSVANIGGLRELRLGRRESASSIQSQRLWRHSTFVQTDLSRHVQQSPPEASSPDGSSPDMLPVVVTPDESPISVAPPPPTGNALGVPSASFAPRTSSLAAKEVFATSEHEPVPEEALLLELVNSKTSEAQARQEVDELKRALNIGRRRQDAAIQQLRAEMEASRIESAKALEAAMAQTAKAVEEARAARAEVEALNGTPLFNLPPVPYLDDASGKSTPVASPQEERGWESGMPKKVDLTPAPAAAAGWGSFWGRRTASRTGIPTPPQREGSEGA